MKRSISETYGQKVENPHGLLPEAGQAQLPRTEVTSLASFVASTPQSLNEGGDALLVVESEEDAFKLDGVLSSKQALLRSSSFK